VPSWPILGSTLTLLNTFVNILHYLQKSRQSISDTAREVRFLRNSSFVSTDLKDRNITLRHTSVTHWSKEYKSGLFRHLIIHHLQPL